MHFNVLSPFGYGLVFHGWWCVSRGWWFLFTQINQIFWCGRWRIPPAGRDVACHVRIMRWYLTYYHHSSADAFPADGGIFSRRYPQIKQIFLIWMPGIPPAGRDVACRGHWKSKGRFQFESFRLSNRVKIRLFWLILAFFCPVKENIGLKSNRL